MISRYARILLLMAVVLSICLGMCIAADIRGEIREATKGFRDISLTAKVIHGDKKELEKIGKDLPKSYDAKTTSIKYKAPDKMKVSGKIGMVGIAIIMNGTKKAYRVPALHISKKEDCSKEPHKLQGDLDIGVVSDQLWRDYIVTDADVVKTSGETTYRIVFVRSNARDKKHIIWVDPKTCRLLKMEKHEADGSLKARYIYSKHQHCGGVVWVPGRVDVYNGDNKLAGATEYVNIKVNTGIPDSEFKI